MRHRRCKDGAACGKEPLSACAISLASWLVWVKQVIARRHGWLTSALKLRSTVLLSAYIGNHRRGDASGYLRLSALKRRHRHRLPTMYGRGCFRVPLVSGPSAPKTRISGARPRWSLSNAGWFGGWLDARGHSKPGERVQ